MFPKLRCPPCVPGTWSSVYAPNQHLFLCFRLKADRGPVGVKPGSEASSLEVLVGRGRPSEGAVLENCPPAKLYIQVHPGDHSRLVTKTERVWAITLLIPCLHSHAQVPSLNLPFVHRNGWILAHEAGDDVGATCQRKEIQDLQDRDQFFIGEPSRSKEPAGQPLRLCLQTVELLFRERTGRLFRNWHKPPGSGWFIYLFIFDQDFLLEEKPVNDLLWSH